MVDNALLTIGTTLAVTSGTFTLGNTGTLAGATVSTGTGGKVILQGGTLSEVTYRGTIDLSQNNAPLTISNNLTMTGAGGTGAGTINLTGPGSTLYNINTGTIANAVINIGNSSNDGFIIEQDMLGTGTTLTLATTTSLIQAGTYVDLFSSGYAGDTILNQGTITAGYAGGQFVVDPDTFINAGHLTVSNGDTFSAYSNSSFSNTGTISVSGGTSAQININSTVFANTGVISVTGVNSGVGSDAIAFLGGTATGTWTNQGTISVSNQGDVILGGTFSLATFQSIKNTGGYQDINGTMLNTGTLVVPGLTAGADTYYLDQNGIIQGGTVVDPNGDLAFNGTLSGVTYVGTISIDDPNNYYTLVTIANNLTMTGAGGTGAGTINLTGPGSTLYNINTGTIANAVINIGNNSGSYIYEQDTLGTGTTLTLATTTSLIQSGGYVELYSNGYAGDAILNQGTIIAGYADGQFVVDPDTFINAGHLTVSNTDTLSIDNPTGAFSNTGLLSVTGAYGTQLVIDTATLTNTGTINVTGVNGGVDGDAYAFLGGTATGTWTNQGTISVSNQGDVILGGTFRPGDVPVHQEYRRLSGTSTAQCSTPARWSCQA